MLVFSSKDFILRFSARSEPTPPISIGGRIRSVGSSTAETRKEFSREADALKAGTGVWRFFGALTGKG